MNWKKVISISPPPAIHAHPLILLYYKCYENLIAAFMWTLSKFFFLGLQIPVLGLEKITQLLNYLYRPVHVSLYK